MLPLQFLSSACSTESNLPTHQTKCVLCVFVLHPPSFPADRELKHPDLCWFLPVHYILAGNRSTIHNPKKRPLQNQLIELQPLDNSYQIQSHGSGNFPFCYKGVEFLKLSAEFGYFKFQLQ